MKKILAFFIPFVIAIPVLSNSQNQADVDVDVFLRQAIVVDNVSDLQFGTLEYDPSDAGGSILLGTDGVVDVATSGYVSAGTPMAGGLDITATAGEKIHVSCTATATLALSTDPNQTMSISDVNYKFNGSSRFCNSGLHDLDSTGTDSINIGAELSVPSGATAQEGNYSTSNNGGTPISFTVTYE